MMSRTPLKQHDESGGEVKKLLTNCFGGTDEGYSSVQWEWETVKHTWYKENVVDMVLSCLEDKDERNKTKETNYTSTTGNKKDEIVKLKTEWV
eukprot:UN28604